MRLDFAAARAFGLSRRAAREAVRAGRIDEAGVTRDEPGLEVPEAAALTFHPDRPARRSVRTALSILHEDDDCVVVDKPAGLLTLPTAEREKDTLLSRVSLYLQHRYRRRPYVGVVHRLDKDTSGAIVFARSREALRALQKLFQRHEIEREYVALVEGDVPQAGRLDADLVRDRGDRRRGVARPGQQGRRAVTHFRSLERLGRAGLVSARLETGRTHQIRVHFAAAGHPVMGDSVYRRRDAPPPPEPAPRQMLHARILGFAHPRTGAMVRCEAPLPRDFEKMLGALRARNKTPRPKPGH
ncbi:MAG: RluA family pseudouridine synthase [Thermoanaerobaculia bacterium]